MKTGKQTLQIVIRLFGILVSPLIPLSVCSQTASFLPVYSGTLRGGTTMLGNTLTHIVTGGVPDTAKMNATGADGNFLYGNDFSNIQYVDVDGFQGLGAGTRNSSSAGLELPLGNNTIKMALLYWGGKARASEFNLDADSCRKIKIRHGSGAYREWRADRFSKIASGTTTSLVYQYQAVVDITSWVQSTGTGTYTAGNAALSVGSAGIGGNYGGWCMVVVYENSQQQFYNNVRVYEGFNQVYNDGTTHAASALLKDLKVCSRQVGERDAKMGVMVWEGDAPLKQDYLKINGVLFQNSLNPANNPWNGTISDTGRPVQTKFPDYRNQMSIDIDRFFVGNGYGIRPGDTALSLEFGTASDQFFSGMFTFEVKSDDSHLQISKRVSDGDGNGWGSPGETLIYTLRGSNRGAGAANRVMMLDTLPASVTYVPASMKIKYFRSGANAVEMTDQSGDDAAEYNSASRVIICRAGTGFEGAMGGILAPLDSFEISFRVVINAGSGNAVPSVVNKAFISGYTTSGEFQSHNSTAVLSALGGPLPVSLIRLSGTEVSPGIVQLNWQVASETNTNHYRVERSADGKSFIPVAHITAAGQSANPLNYAFRDTILSFASLSVFYRLVPVDRDGSFSVSRTVTILLSAKSPSLSAGPNPFASHINAEIFSEVSEDVEWVLCNASGIICFRNRMRLEPGKNRIFLNGLGTLSPGLYVLKFQIQGRAFGLKLVHL